MANDPDEETAKAEARPRTLGAILASRDEKLLTGEPLTTEEESLPRLTKEEEAKLAHGEALLRALLIGKGARELALARAFIDEQLAKVPQAERPKDTEREDLDRRLLAMAWKERHYWTDPMSGIELTDPIPWGDIPALVRLDENKNREDLARHGPGVWPAVWAEWRGTNEATLAARAVLMQAAEKDELAADGRAEARLALAVTEKLPEARAAVVRKAEEPDELDGMYLLDARLADFLTDLGTDAAKLAKGYRAKWRTDWAQVPLPGQPHDALERWTDCLRLPRVLANVLWKASVRAAIKKDAARERGILRASTSVVATFGQGRAYGGVLAESEVMIEPPTGLTLALPFNEGLRVAKRDGGIVPLRQLLSGRALRTYLATMVIYQDTDGGPDYANGLFETHGAGTILDVIGAKRYERKKGGRVYQAYHSKEMDGIRADLALFAQIRVRAVGNLEAVAGDPLVDELRDRRQGKRVWYAHSRLVVAELHNNYLRIPRAICKLEADDVPLGLGIAALARQRMARHLEGRGPIEAPILEWVKAAGMDAAEQSRKHGRNFWPSVSHDLSRVAEEGKLGKIHATGQGKDMLLSLELDPTLRKSYAPLLANVNAQRRAKNAARVRKHLA